MTGSHLRKVNEFVPKGKKQDWNVDLSEVIGTKGISMLLVEISNAADYGWEPPLRERTYRVFLSEVSYCQYTPDDVDSVDPMDSRD